MALGAKVIGLAQCLQHLQGDVPGLGAGVPFLRCKPLQQNQEFVPPQTCHAVCLAHAVLQALGHLDQQLVAHAVSQGVVELLEVVQVQEQHRTMFSHPRRMCQDVLQPVHQKAAVGQAGELVVKRQFVDLRLVLSLLADVPYQSDPGGAALTLCA